MEKHSSGLELLRRPLVPLTYLVSRIFLTTGLESVEATIAKLKDNINLEGVSYDQPSAILAPYLDLLKPYELFKKGVLTSPSIVVVNGDKEPVDPVAALILQVKQNMVSRELEQINSALCGQYNCTICCRGPVEGEENGFFELPIEDDEIALIDLPRVDTESTRNTNAYADPPLAVNAQAFYFGPPALYRWREKWGMILTRNSVCPNLEPSTGRCLKYENRPSVCRLPQIFPIVLEKVFDPDFVKAIAERLDYPMGGLSDINNYYVAREKILAVWDCPYVREYKHEIIRFAETSSLEPVFRSNKK